MTDLKHKNMPESELKVGDRVTVLSPSIRDPLMVEMQPHVWVAEVLPDGTYMLENRDEPLRRDETYGPYPRTRLKAGW